MIVRAIYRAPTGLGAHPADESSGSA